MYSRLAQRLVSSCGVATAAAMWSVSASPVAAKPRFEEGTPEYDAAKALFEAKHDVPLEGMPPRPPALSPDEFRAFTVTNVAEVSPDTRRITFALPTEEDTLGLTITSCLVAKADIDGKAVVRPYTPVSSAHQHGSFELVVKGYDDGNVSKYMTSLSAGDQVHMKGPFAKLPYTPNMKKAIGLIAGGTGITPMYQLIRAILENPRDKTEVRLLFANKTPSDVLLKDELDALATLYPNFKVYYTVDTPHDSWQGFSGYINKAMVAATLPPPAADHLVCVCGPPGMVSAVSGPLTKDHKQGELTGLLKDMGYAADGVFKF